MIDRIRGWLARVGCLALLLVGGAAGWVFQDRLQRVWADRLRPAATAAMTAVGGDAPTRPAPVRSAERTDSVEPDPSAGEDASAVEGADEGGSGSPGVEGVGTEEETTTGDDDAVAPHPAPDAGAEAEAEEPTERTPDRRIDPEVRLRELFGPGGSGEVRLDSADLARLVERREDYRLPEGVEQLRVHPRDSALEASAGVDLARLLGDRLPAMLQRMVGDSARVSALLQPAVPSRGTLRVRVLRLEAGSVGLPSATIPWLLGELGLPMAADDPRSVELRPGRGLSRARMEEGVLVLARDSAGRRSRGRMDPIDQRE